MKSKVPFSGWRKLVLVLVLCAAAEFLLGILGCAPGLAPTPGLLRLLLLAAALCIVLMLLKQKPGYLTGVVLLSVLATLYEAFVAFLSAPYAGIMQGISPIFRIVMTLLPLLIALAASATVGRTPEGAASEPEEKK